MIDDSLRGERILNALLWALFGTGIAKGLLPRFANALHWIISILFLILLFWILFRFLKSVKWNLYESRIYKRVRGGDWWRLFALFWIGYEQFASSSPFLFFVASLFSLPLFFILVSIGISDSVLEKNLSSRAIGSFVFAFLLFGWQKSAFVVHYGVPIIGHYLEKPNFEATYFVEIRKFDTSPEYMVPAEVKVQTHWDSDYAGYDDRLGNPVFDTFSRREIWLNKVRLPSGGWIKVEQDEPITIEDGGYFEDRNGQLWSVEITDRQVL